MHTMRIGVIIPTRNDRPDFVQHLIEVQIPAQTRQPDKIYLMDSSMIKPGKNVVDLPERFVIGMQQAAIDDMERIYIMEDDDYYPDDYLTWGGDKKIDFLGYEKSVYYHLFRQMYRTIEHKDRSSLFCTAFDLCAGNGYVTWLKRNWSVMSQNPWLDIKLWEFAKACQYRRAFIKPDSIPIGIKHGLGFCAGKGHQEYFMYNKKDYAYRYLKEHTRPESFEFYIEMIEKYVT